MVARLSKELNDRQDYVVKRRRGRYIRALTYLSCKLGERGSKIRTINIHHLACVQLHKQQQGILSGCSPGGAVLGGCLGLTLAAKAAKAQPLGLGDGHRYVPFAETSCNNSDRSSRLAAEERR